MGVSMNARDVMSRDVLTLNKVETVKDLLKILESCSHNGFPVINPKNHKFLGTMQREMLHRIMYYGHGCDIYQSPNVPVQQPPPMVAYEKSVFSKKAMRLKQFPTLDKIKAQLSAEDWHKLIDLKPYLNRGCFTVQERASLSRVYTFFRTMGLRHLPVLNGNGHLTGIITRKDLIIPHSGKGHSAVSASSCISEAPAVGNRRAYILSEIGIAGEV